MNYNLKCFLYGCETWPLTLKECYSLRTYESMVLKRLFGPKWEEVAGGCRRLHDEELHTLCA